MAKTNKQINKQTNKHPDKSNIRKENLTLVHSSRDRTAEGLRHPITSNLHLETGV